MKSKFYILKVQIPGSGTVETQTLASFGVIKNFTENKTNNS